MKILETHFGLGPVSGCGNSETKRALITRFYAIHPVNYLLLVTLAFREMIYAEVPRAEPYEQRGIVSPGKFNFEQRRASSGEVLIAFQEVDHPAERREKLLIKVLLLVQPQHYLCRSEIN